MKRSGLVLAALLLAAGCETQQVVPEPVVPFVETQTDVTLTQFMTLYAETCLAYVQDYPDFEGLERRLSELGFKVSEETFYSKVMFNVATGSEIVFGSVRNHADSDDGPVYFPPVDTCILTGAINDYGSLTPELLEESFGYDFGFDQDTSDEFYFELNFLQADHSNKIEVITSRARENRQFRSSSFPPECANMQECEVRRIEIVLQSQQGGANG